MKKTLYVKRLDPRAILPTVAHPGEDLGFDLYALEDTLLDFEEPTKVRTGIAAKFTVDPQFMKYGLEIGDRSSMALKGIRVGGGKIDAGYRGEIIVILTYLATYKIASKRGNLSFLVKAGDKIAQMIPTPVLTDKIVEVDDLGESYRGDKGFGSSGR